MEQNRDMKFRDQLTHLFVLLFFGLVVSVNVGRAQVPDLTGTWTVTVTGVNGTDEFRWELKKGRAITPDHNSWGITRTLDKTTNNTKRTLLRTPEYAGSIEFRGGKLEYRTGANMFVQSGTCELAGDELTCKGKETIGLANGREFDFTIRGNRVGGAPKTVETPKQERLPIIFLPGIAGTQLFYQGPTGSSTEVWPLPRGVPGAAFDLFMGGAFDADPARIQMAFNLKADDVLESKIQTGTILRSGQVDFYSKTISFLEGKGYKEGTDLFTFPHDWRLNNSDHFPALDRLINDALRKTQARKAILLAHSMGGLIARAYLISNPQGAAKVDSLITMASPGWGAPKPFYAAADGYTFGNPSISKQTMKFISQNWPTLYQLMPQIPFIQDKATGQYLSLEDSRTIKYRSLRWVNPIWIEDDSGVSDLWGLNKTLLNRSDVFYAPLGTKEKPTPLPSGVKYYAIIGTGIRTLSGYSMRSPETTDWTKTVLERHVLIGGRPVVLEPIFDDGDGTVPVWSAEVDGATRKYYVQYEDNFDLGTGQRDVSSEHSQVPSNPKALRIVDKILQGDPPAEIYHEKSGKIVYVADAKETVDLVIHSDAHLNVFDAAGGRLGYNSIGGFHETLGTGTFLDINGYEYASFHSVAKPYKVLVNGITDGKFTLFVTISRAGKKIAGFSYKEVPVKKGTIAQFELFPRQAASNPPQLNVTTEGKTSKVAAVELPPDQPPIALASRSDVTSDGTFLGTIPSFGGTVTSFRFFTTNEDIPPPQGMREYQTRFSKATLGTVYYEFSVKYVTENAANFTMASTWSRGAVPLVRQELPVAKPANWNTSTRSYGYGSKEPGKWETGTYTVKVEVEGRKVAEGSFVVY